MSEWTVSRSRHRVPIREESDVVIARASARELARRGGFSEGGAGAIATAVSELARNIVVHAGVGEIVLSLAWEGGCPAIVVVAHDERPGIRDVEAAMRDGFSTGKGLGLGLSSARRLMDEFTLVSEVGRGTTVTMKKWAGDRSR